MRLLVIPGYSEVCGEANLICLHELLSFWKENSDLTIDVAGVALKKENVSVSLSRPVEYIKKIWNWPVISPSASQKCYEEIVACLAANTYDAMLVMHMPYDAVLAAMRAQKRFPHVKLFLYELDPITYEIDKQRKSLGRYLYFMRERAERKTFRSFDKIFHMECNRKKFSSKKYDRYRDKFEYLDFPLIHDLNQEERSVATYDGECIKLIYTGKIMAHFRSPEYLLNVLTETGKHIPIDVKFFSAGNCEKMIESYAQQFPFIHQCGYVDKLTLQKEIEVSDCLINIGNKLSDMLPSKLLTYIETGMPILHVKNQENDACVSYLERYDLSLIIDENDPVSECVDSLISFLKDMYGKRVGSKQIVKNYEKNTPAFSACSIYKALQR